jgi:hypothetical protein
MAKRKKNRGKRPPWTPFEERDPTYWKELYLARYGPAGAKPDSAGVSRIPIRVCENSIYTVFVHDVPQPEGWPEMLTLSIRMHTRDVIRDWRDLQRIKNEVIGPENEAVELFPAESRLVDSANQFHLWVLKDPKARFPFGFTVRAVTDGTSKPDFMGAVQRKMDNPPADALTPEEYEAKHREALERGQDREPPQAPGTVHLP